MLVGLRHHYTCAVEYLDGTRQRAADMHADKTGKQTVHDGHTVWCWQLPSPSSRAKSPNTPGPCHNSLVLGRWLAASPNVDAAPTWGKARIPVWLGSARLSWELACCPPSVAPSHLPHFHFLLIFPPTAQSQTGPPHWPVPGWLVIPLLPLSIWPAC